MNKLLLQYLNHSNSSPTPSRPASCDSSSSQTNNNDSKNIKYKTELCRTYEEKGSCPYNHRCRFAHGKAQLVIIENDSSKKKKCNGFWTQGCCSYGRRCKFGHDEINWENTACLLAIEARCVEEKGKSRSSKLMKMLS